MNRNYQIYFVFLLTFTFFFNACKETSWTLNSPDKALSFLLYQETNKNNKKVLFYELYSTKNGESKKIIEASPLGIECEDANFFENLTLISKSNIKHIQKNYNLMSGKKRNISYKANEVSYVFSNDKKQKLKLHVRVFNEGVAFRYIFPEKNEQKIKITKEYTGFNIPDSGKAWISPYDKAAPWAPAYERYFTNGSPIGETAPEKQGWAFPALFSTQNHWILISESGLADNYAATHLQPKAPNGLYSIRFPEIDERYKEGDIYPSAKPPWKMPWRFILISDKIGDIVESNMVTHLSTPSKVKDTSWIEPGKASWGWWSSTNGRTVKRLKKYIDLAADMGWKYSLVDAAWENMPDGTIQDVIDYAKTKDIGIWIWYNSGGRREKYFRENYIMADDELRKKEMQKLQNLGVKGLKIDFFNSDKPHIIKLYHDIMRDAAKHKLLLNFHGCTLPRGWRRTYPNLLTLESIRGGESYRFDKDFPEKAPWHNTIAVFTRNVVGPMDFTPCTFSNNKYPHQTTYAHELALSVVFESGIVHMADRDSAYRNLPEIPKNFLKNVPVTWDETKFVEGTPGKFVILARRKGNRWYIAGINGTAEKHTTSIDLSFLSKKKNYRVTCIEDGENPESFKTSVKNIQNRKKMDISMAAKGGFAYVFE